MTEEAEEAEAAETVEDSDGSDISDSSEEPQEPAPHAEKKSAKIPAGGPSTAPSVAVDAEAEFSKVEAIPGGVNSPPRSSSANGLLSMRSTSCTASTTAKKAATEKTKTGWRPNRADSSCGTSQEAGSSTPATTSPPGWHAS